MLIEVDKVKIQRRGHLPGWFSTLPTLSISIKSNELSSPVITVKNRKECRVGLAFKANTPKDEIYLVLKLDKETMSLPLGIDSITTMVSFKNYKVSISCRAMDTDYFSMYEMDGLRLIAPNPHTPIPNIKKFSTHHSTKNNLIKRVLYNDSPYKVNPKTFETTGYSPILQNNVISEAHRYTLSLLEDGITTRSKEDEEFLRNLRRLRSSPKMFISIFFHVSLEVSRESILYSFYKLYANPYYKKDLYKRITVKFVGEMGEDHGALRKEFFELAGNELVQDRRFILSGGLFDLATVEEMAEKIEPGKEVLSISDTEFYTFVGFFIGHVIFQQVQISVRFSRTLYMALLKKKGTYNDIANETLKTSLDWIKNNSVDQMEFVLKSGKKVTDANKEEFIEEFIYEETYGKRVGYPAMAHGFSKAVSDDIYNFQPHQLERLLSGVDHISIKHLKTLAIYRECTFQTEEVMNFWHILENSNEEFRRNVLRFITGSSSLQSIPGSHSECIVITHMNIQGFLPTANTCFRRIVLYKYKSYSELKNKLERAVKENGGFHFI
ncbi:E3 ubiquitin ligase SMURF1/2 [Nematocida sp. AWRm78]|nr:E3 ubiquitin ligase SMURF1/2 [Nematocida sp. AWRm79]KAI5182397.1 E3 ubiquitin ligase SMURF1/2 [Nematocida sp. AWRm78]